MSAPLFQDRLRLDPPGDEAARYLALPFDVPAAGLPGLRVTLAYDRERARLDFGLWDSRGFRGWSGSERAEMRLGPLGATPGYLPGEIEGGTWAVWVGVYVVADGGVDVDVTVATDATPPAGTPTPAVTLSPRRRRDDIPPDWRAGDLHCHTVHSDGSLTVLDVALLARDAGLDFLAVTDHNTVSHHAELPAAEAASGVTLIPGQEVTSYGGHANALGPLPWVDFREPADAWRTAVADGGGLLSVNHPVAGDCSWRQPLSGPPDLIELWHGDWGRRMDAGAQTVFGFLEKLGYPVAVGGSDFHRPGYHSAIGSPTTWVEAPDGDILAGLAAGRVAVSAAARGPVALPVDGRIEVSAGAGTVLCDRSGGRRPVTSERVTLPAAEGIHWLERDGLVEAMCEPGRGV
jgi:hypothetical protein